MILPVANKISGKDAAEPVQVAADADNTEDEGKTETTGTKEEVTTDETKAIRCLWQVYLMLPVLRI